MSKSRPHTLVIEDTGIGIRAEDLPRVFEKGFTGYNGREENRSTGIGLYLCGKIMKRLDHGIRIESELGKGRRYFLNWKERRWIYIRACSEKQSRSLHAPLFGVFCRLQD